MNKYEKISGMLTIDKNNIFSILKKWLYTEQDIVFRELISNACDAIEKLSSIEGEGEHSEKEIVVTLDAEARELIISDNGVGMSVEEIDKYINNIAFSGAEEFINANNQSGRDTIIGHFGVGFYSAFMLTDHVAIETKSYRPDISAVRWDCTEDMSYSMDECERVHTGTDVILYLPENSEYLGNPQLIYDIIKKYFVFSKTAIFFNAPGYDRVLVNTPNPIWRMPKELADREKMNEFYKDFFSDTSDPMFWIQFESLDIGVRGILFFRNTKNGTEELDGTIKVYNRGVYIGDNIRQIIPKFVNLQSGIIECDNLPLAVSRSSIRENEQQDEMLGLIYECLAQEVTIAMHDMFQNRREEYQAHWSNINAFVKYAVLKDKTFASVMTNKVIFKDLYQNYYTIREYLEKEDGEGANIVYYASDELDQAHYIEIFKKCNLNALILDHVIDQPYMQKYEAAHPKIKFIRMDSNIESLFKGYLPEEDYPKVSLLEQKLKSAIGDRLNDITLRITNLEQDSISMLIINDEFSRRMSDMMEIYGYISATDVDAKKKQVKSTLLVNLNNEIIRFILESDEGAAVRIVANQLFDLSLMTQQALKPEDVEQFINRSETILAASIRD